MTILSGSRRYLLECDAFIQQSADAHGSEYTAETDGRRAAVTGFTGSAGTAVFTKTDAALWTDGRYFIQAEQELNSDWILMKAGLPGTESIEDWLIRKVPEGT